MLKIGKKFWQFVIGGLRYDPHVFIYFIWHLFIPTKSVGVTELSYDEILTAIRSGKSFIRLGDGEALILTGRDIYFQPTSPALAQGLRTIIERYTTDSPYLLGVPSNKLILTEEELGNVHQRKMWRLYRTLFPVRFPQNVTYAPLTFFYVGKRFEDNIVPLLKNRHVIFVSNEAVLSDTLRNYAVNSFAAYSFVETLATNAFAAQEIVKEQIDKAINESDCIPVILFAVGPVSKLLAYEYAVRGIQSLDIGQGMKLIATGADRSHKI